MSDKTIVSSWNEWDPLKHVIVGKADGTCIPAPEPALDAKVPEDSDMRGQFGPRTKDTVDKANQLLDDFSRMLEKTRQRIRTDVIETLNALDNLLTSFNTVSLEDQSYGDKEVILSYSEMMKKFEKKFTSWNDLKLHADSQVTATNMGAESVFAIFKIREVRNRKSFIPEKELHESGFLFI